MWGSSIARPSHLVQSLILCCSDSYSVFHHDMSWLVQLSLCRSAKVPIAPARRCHLLCCLSYGKQARVFPYVRICVRNTSLPFSCWTNSIQDHPVGVCITCGHSPTYMGGSVFQTSSVKTTGLVFALLCSLWRWTVAAICTLQLSPLCLHIRPLSWNS